MVPKILGGFYLLGVVGMLVGWAWLRRRAFAESVWWGLACLFVPGGSLVFLVRRWDDARDPFIASALGFACILPLVLSNPLRFAQSFSVGYSQGGVRSAFLLAAFPPEPARTVRHDPWPMPVEEADEPDADAEPTPTPGPSDAFEREAEIAAHAEQREREARQAAYARHRAEADALYQDLNARRSRLKGDDARAVAAFNAEAARYAALLEQTRTERMLLERPTTVVVAPDPVVFPAARPVPGRGAARSAGAVAVSTLPGNRPTSVAATGTGDNPSDNRFRSSLEAARRARDAASGAEDAGAWGADVYGEETAATPGAGGAFSPTARR